MAFTRLEPLPGARWLHADGESVPATVSPDRPEQDAPVSGDTGPERVVVSFGPELAIEKARRLAPRPTVIVFAAFQFDPEAAIAWSFAIKARTVHETFTLVLILCWLWPLPMFRPTEGS